jgi:uncharacterized protein YdaU (DUF1376 family)
MHYYRFNIGDYARDTQHLDEMEDLAYRRMLDMYYLKEQPLPRSIEKIARLIRMRSHTDCIANVLEEFFICKPDGYHNSGADDVLEDTYSRSEKARLAAEKRWNKNKELDNASALPEQTDSSADAMPPTTQDPLPNTHNKENSVKQVLPPCPHQEIINIWSEVMPEQRQPRVWDGQRAANLTNRWKECFKIMKSDNSGPLYTDKNTGLEFWRGFFLYMRNSDFLINDCKPFGLDWIVNKTNFTKIFEGNYHG